MDNATSQQAARSLGDIAADAVQDAADQWGAKLAPAVAKARKFPAIARDAVAGKPITAMAVTLGLGLLLGAVLARR